MPSQLLAILLALSALLLPTLMDGLERKVRARVQSRIGPPILQSWYDVLKLLSKDFYVPANSVHTAALLLLYFVFQSLLTAYLIVSATRYLTSYDLAIAASLYVVLQATFISIPFTMPNPFSIVGASREIMLVVINESFFVVAVALYMLYAEQARLSVHVVALLAALLLNSYVSSGRVPFDIAEAEPELASGLMIELSGPLLGLFVYSVHVKRFFVKLLPSILLLRLFVNDGLLLAILSIPAVVLLWLAYSIVSTTLGRSRVDLAPITLLKIYIALILFSIVGYLLGV